VRLQHTATRCNTLQHAATHCNMLQRHCNTLQHIHTHTHTHHNTLQHSVTHSITLHRTATRVTLSTPSMCTLCQTATHCNTLQSTATRVTSSMPKLSTGASATMTWLRVVGSFKLSVSFAGYSLFCRALLQKRPVILRSLLIVATPYCTFECNIARSTGARECNNCSLLHTATHCNTLQHTATHCNTLQHTATHCNTLQPTERGLASATIALYCTLCRDLANC